MKIAFNPSTVAALTSPPNNKDITFDLRGQNIFARGVKFYGTDTNTWRDIKINNVSIGSHTLDLRNGGNTTLTNTNGVVTINSTWRPVVDNLTSNSTTSSLSANQGRVLAGLINGKSDSDHNHDGRYLKLTGGTLTGNLVGTSAMFSGRFYGNGDDEGIIIKPSSNGYAGLILGTHGGERSIFYFVKNKPFWRYSHGSDNLDIMHPKKSGTIALTSDIPSKNSWNYDDRYYTKAESNAKYITDITTSVNKLTFTKNGSNITRDITVNVVHNQGNLTNIPDKDATTKASSGLYIYNSYGQIIGTNYYSSVLSITTGGTIQIAGNWGDDYSRNLYWRSQSDRAVSSYPWKSWRTILDSENYSSTLDSRYYTESEVNSLLDAKLNRQNLSYGTWNPRGYHLAADYFYNGGDLSISESEGQIHVSIDGYFWQNEGQYRVLDTSDVAGLKGNLTVHQYLSNTDTTWWPLIWGGSSHNNTSDSTGNVYKSHDVLSWQTSSQTLYATNIRTENIKHLSIGGGIYWNPNVESATDGSDAASITLVKSGVAGGTTLVLSQMNDTNDTIQFKTNAAAKLYHNSYPILTTQNTYVNNHKGYINGTEITQVNNADTLDGAHLIRYGNGTGIKQVYYFHTQGNNTSYIKLGTLNTVAVTGAGSSKVMFTVKGGINFGGTNESVYEVAASTRGSIQVTSTLVRGNRELKFGYVSTSSNVEIWMAYDGTFRGVTEVEVSSSVSFTLAMTETTTKPSGFVEGSYRILASTADNVASATKLQTPRSIWGQSFDGTRDVDNTLRIRHTTSNYCEGIRIQTGDGAWSTIILGATGDSGTNANAWSIHRKGDNNFAISRNSSDGVNGLVMTSVGMGLGTTAPTQRLDVVGNIRATGQIIREGSSQMWVNGRKGALLRETSVAGYHALWSLKTTNGSWDFGEYNAGSAWNNIPVLSYITDSNYNSGNNEPTYQIKFPLASGTVALTSNIPSKDSWNYDDRYVRAGAHDGPNLNSLDTYSFIKSVNSTVASTSPNGNTGWYNVIQAVHRNGAYDGPNYIGQIALGMTTNINGMFYRTKYGGSWYAWNEVVTTNTGLLRYSRNNVNISSPNCSPIPPSLLEWTVGYPRLYDPEFNEGDNNVWGYNNAGNGVVTVTRVHDTNVGNSSSYVMKVVSAAGAIPNYGGWHVQTQTELGKVYTCLFRASIPSGVEIEWNSNSIGTGGQMSWLTNNMGTGKWTWYAVQVYCGSGGSTTFFFSAKSPCTWYLSYVNVIENNRASYAGLRSVYSDYLKANASIVFGRNELQYFNQYTGVTAGATNNANPKTDWYHILRMNHANNSGYFVDLAIPFFDNKIQFRRITSGSDNGWRRIITEEPNHDVILREASTDGNVGIGINNPAYKLDVNGQMRAEGFHHGTVNSDNYMLLAGGGYKSFGGDASNPIFLGYLNLDHGNDGTISSSFSCLGYSVPFTYTRGGNYCRIYIPDTTHQVFFIKAATASVNYSGGGMDTWTGVHRGSGAWWLHCYAYGTNEIGVKGFCQNNNNNDSWWGGNPLWSGNDGANKITVCIFGYVKFR